jgi:hypothetical protein
MATRRKHRRKYPKGATCKCPKGAKRVVTCRTTEVGRVCTSRGFSCIGKKANKNGKLVPRFVAMECSGGEVPKKKGRRKKPSPKQLLLPSGDSATRRLLGA